MNTSVLAFVVLALFCAIPNAWGGTATPDANCVYHCPPGESTINGEPPSADNTACDPAFVTYERAWASLKQAVAGVNQRARKKEAMFAATAGAEAEKSLLNALDQARSPEQARSVAVEAWKSGVPPALQRQALVLVRSLNKASSEEETLSFMLAALDNPAAQMDRCRELGRGTPVERKTAANRLALLLQNPNLADRLK